MDFVPFLFSGPCIDDRGLWREGRPRSLRTARGRGWSVAQTRVCLSFPFTLGVTLRGFLKLAEPQFPQLGNGDGKHPLVFESASRIQ